MPSCVQPIAPRLRPAIGRRPTRVSYPDPGNRGENDERPRSVPLTPMAEVADGSHDRAAGGAGGLLPSAPAIVRRSASSPPKTRNRFIADLVARRASLETWRVHHARHGVPHVGRRGAHKASLGTSGTAAGWKRGRGPSAFFRAAPIVFQSAPQPAIRPHLMRDPVNRPRARPRGERAGTLALRDFAGSRIRCSWTLGPVCFRRASPSADDGAEHEGSPKNFPWPRTASAPSAQPDVPRPMSNPKRGSAPPAPGLPPNDG